MLCEKCGAYMPDDAITCEGCGTLMKRKPQPEPGVRGIRQGRASLGSQPLQGSSRTEPNNPAQARRDKARDVPMYREDRPQERRRGVERFSEDAGRPQSRRGIPRVSESQVRKLRVRQDKAHPVRKHMVNWMYMLAILGVLIVLGVIGLFFYLNRTPAGQLILARMGRDANAQAYWQVGEEYMDQGQVVKAIEIFVKADALDPNNVDGLLSLAAAYEAFGQVEDAQALYVKLYTDISPERPEAYRNQIRLLISQDRTPEAADLMKLAYEKTGIVSFNQQRNQTLPEMPKTDLAAGRYTQEKQVTLISPQDYDILYLLGEGDIKKDGKPYEGPILLKEGAQQRVRAVCVSEDLFSDPLDVTYSIVMPSPDAPKAGLAPGTYEKPQRVWLRYTGKDKDVTMYYTLDGSAPDLNSPQYTGDPIKLPGGHVTLKAIAVNSYGKSSNVMEVDYKINQKFRLMYNLDDVFGGFTLLQTTRESFESENGQPSSQEPVTVKNLQGECIKLIYGWGYCIVTQMEGQWVVMEVSQKENHFVAPRSTKVGDTEESVTGQYRDMLQPESKNGDRSLYVDGKSTGIIKKVSDKQTSVQYACADPENRIFQLQYDVSNGIVTAISFRYVP